MKILKITLTTLISLLGVLLITITVFILSNKCFRNYKEDKLNINWMENYSDEILLTELVIPGSHDAGCYDMNYLGQTQYLTIKEQLEVGVRYFDLRVRKKDDSYVIFHSIINGVNFDDCFNDILNFIKNSNETLILDFQHFDNSEDYIYSLVTTKLKDYLIVNNTSKSDIEFISQLKLKDSRGKCLVFFGNNKYDDEYIFVRNNDSLKRENSSLHSHYDSNLHSLSSNEFINKLDIKFNEIKEKFIKDEYITLNVLQLQLTDSKYIFGPFSRERSHEENISNYITCLKDHNDFNYVNIILRDFIDYNKCEEIIKLNNYKFGGVK